jgi:hypothetical protein
MSNEKTSEDTGYELSDVNVKTILAAGVVMVIATVISFVFSFVVAKSLSQGKWENLSDYEKSVLADEHNEWIDNTRLQSLPGSELAVHNTEQLINTGSYGTVSGGENQPKIYLIPVDVAIDLVAENGLPAFPVVEAKE